MDEAAATAFNKKFQQYEGNNVRGTQVNALIDTIIQNNLSNSNDDSKIVKLKLDAVTWIGDDGHTLTKTFNEMNPVGAINFGKAAQGKSYSVKCTPDPKSGYIQIVTIKNS